MKASFYLVNNNNNGSKECVKFAWLEIYGLYEVDTASYRIRKTVGSNMVTSDVAENLKKTLKMHIVTSKEFFDWFHAESADKEDQTMKLLL